MELRGSTFLLRSWRAGDEQSLASHANNPKIARNLGAFFPSPYTLQDASDWVALQGAADAREQKFAIVVGNEAVGGIGVQPKTGVHSCKASLGYWLGESHWGRGIVTEAVGLVTEYAFSQLELSRVEALVYARNPASRRVLEKAAFELEGTLRANAIKDGELLDTYLYAKLAI